MAAKRSSLLEQVAPTAKPGDLDPRDRAGKRELTAADIEKGKEAKRRKGYGGTRGEGWEWGSVAKARLVKKASSLIHLSGRGWG